MAGSGPRIRFTEAERAAAERDVATTIARAKKMREAWIVAARKDINYFVPFVMRDEATGAPLVQSRNHVAWHNLMNTHTRVVVWGHVESGKGLALTTDIPAPYGWKTMGSLRVGDVILGGDGRPARVTFVTEEHRRPCYRVVFDDGAELIVDDEHRWKIRIEPGAPWRVLETGDIFRAGSGFGWEIPVAGEPGEGRRLAAIEPVPTVPTKCITVDSADSTYLAGRDYVVTHNTSQLVGRILWELGDDPTHRIAVVSNTYGQSEKIVRAVQRYLESSQELRQVFPRLRPSGRRGDSFTASSITVERDQISRDPSVVATGYHGNILGARLSRLYIDDAIDYENSRTETGRKEFMSWMVSTLFGRLLEGSKVIMTGNAWAPGDAMHELERQGLAGGPWRSMRFPVLDAEGNPTWPERWSPERIAAKRRELGPLEFARQMMCVARDDESSRFKRDWIDRCALRGQGLALYDKLDRMPEGCRTFTGVDLAVKRKKSSDSTAVFTIMVHPNGDRQLIGLRSGKWDVTRIIEEIVHAHRAYDSLVIVEDNNSQDFLIQFTQLLSAVPIIPVTTTSKDYHPVFGIESVAVEMANGKWIIPCASPGSYDPETYAWAEECFFFDPNGHPGDRLMAMWKAVQGARMYEKSSGTGKFGIRILG